MIKKVVHKYITSFYENYEVFSNSLSQLRFIFDIRENSVEQSCVIVKKKHRDY